MEGIEKYMPKKLNGHVLYYIFVESIHDVPRIVRKYKDVSFLEKFPPTGKEPFVELMVTRIRLLTFSQEKEPT